MTIAEKLLRGKTDLDEVYAAGKKAEYDAFWDAYQQNGTRTDYGLAFAGEAWTLETFRPKYHMNVTYSYMMFRSNKIEIDLAKYLSDLGITLDFSRLTGWQSYIFSLSNFTRIGRCDFSKTSYLQSVFTNCSKLKTIDALVVATYTGYAEVFKGCYELENLTIEGVIGKSGFDVSESTKLSKSSITSIINALSATTTGLTVTLSLVAVNKAFETSEGANDGNTSAVWTELVGTKTDWNISLV